MKSLAAAGTSDYKVIVVGGPIYVGTPDCSPKDCLNNLKPDQEANVGVFGSGQGATSQSDIDMIRSAVLAI